MINYGIKIIERLIEILVSATPTTYSEAGTWHHTTEQQTDQLTFLYCICKLAQTMLYNDCRFSQ